MASAEEVIEQYYEALKAPNLSEEGFAEITARINRLKAMAEEA